jgi:FG-GAP repeat
VGTAWKEELILRPSQSDAEDQFGARVALSANGGRVFVGSPDEAGDAQSDELGPNNNAPGAGAVYEF